MAHPKLDSLVHIDLLKIEAPARTEFEGLVRTGLARQGDAKNESNSIDGRFDLAYNAAHALSLAALRWHGYRPNNKRYIVFQALEHTLGLAAKQWRVLSEAHDKRNRTEYEGAVDIEPALLEALDRYARACPSAKSKYESEQAHTNWFRAAAPASGHPSRPRRQHEEGPFRALRLWNDG